MSKRYFYKVYLNDVVNIVKTDDNESLVNYLSRLFGVGDSGLGITHPNHSSHLYFTPENKYFWVSFNGSWGWMMLKKEKTYEKIIYGYDYLTQNNYEYRGEYLSKIMQRKLKLEKLNGNK